jgi:hypothetical protein
MDRTKREEVMDEMAGIIDRLNRIERLLLEQKTVKDWYTTAEVGDILNKSEYTVREWARLGRIRASKRACGRGRAKEWVVSHEELTRLRNQGLLPDSRLQPKS